MDVVLFAVVVSALGWAAGVATAIQMGWASRGWPHRHRWSEWADFVEMADEQWVRYWERQRRCLHEDCPEHQSQQVGRHDCFLYYDDVKPCPHRAQFSALFVGSAEYLQMLEADVFKNPDPDRRDDR